MATVLQIVSPADQSTVLWDFNDPAGTAAWSVENGGVMTEGFLGGAFDLRTAPLETSIFEPPARDGGLTVFSRRGLLTSSLRMRMTAASHDGLLAGIARLQALMEAGGVMKYVAHGSAETRFIDFEPSPAPALLDGRELELYLVARLFDRPDGIVVSFLRQPWMRGPELDPTVNLLKNSTLYGDSNGTPGLPDLWTSVAGTHSIVAADEAYQNSHTAVSNLITQNFTSGNGTFTVSGYARRVSGPGSGVLRVSSVGGTGSTDSAAIASAAWQRFTATVTTSGATTAVQVALRQGVASGTTVLQFRNIQLETGSSASPYRVGEETLNNDPASAGLGRVVPVYIHGSMPVRPRLLIGGNIDNPRVGVRSRSPVTGDRSLLTYLNGGKFSQVEGWTLGTDTTAAADANASPQSGNTHAVTTFATPSLALRADTILTNAGTLAALKGGTWRVVLRCGTSVTLTVFTIQLKWSWGTAGTETTLNEERAVTIEPESATNYQDFALATVTFPDRVPDGLELRLFASRVSGTGSLKSDFLFFVPAEPLVEVAPGPTLGATDWSELDSDKNTAATLNSGLVLVRAGTTTGPMKVSGPLPVLRPGLNLIAISDFLVTTAITMTAPVRLYYSPRYHA